MASLGDHIELVINLNALSAREIWEELKDLYGKLDRTALWNLEGQWNHMHYIFDAEVDPRSTYITPLLRNLSITVRSIWVTFPPE